MEVVGPLAASLQNATHLNLQSEVTFHNYTNNFHAFFFSLTGGFSFCNPKDDHPSARLKSCF